MTHPPAFGPAEISGSHPSEIVAAILSSDTITLDGFGQEPMPGSWLRPALRFVPADVSVADGGVSDELSARARAIRWTRRGIGASLLLALLSTAFWMGVASRPAPTEASSQWFVSGVGAQGVIVSSDSVALLVSPGEKLPNGEILQAVIPERSTFVTNRSTVRVQGRQTAPAAAPIGLAPASPAAR